MTIFCIPTTFFLGVAQTSKSTQILRLEAYISNNVSNKKVDKRITETAGEEVDSRHFAQVVYVSISSMMIYGVNTYVFIKDIYV